jgi:hypothetical protein
MTHTQGAEAHRGATVRLYHHTTTEAACRIARDRRMRSADPVHSPFAFFSTRLDGLAAGANGYGSAAIAVDVPADLVIPDEGFRTGEQYVKVRLEDLRPEHFVGVYLPEEPAPVSMAELASALSVDNDRLGPSLPGYHHHHSVVTARGWEQPRLDGGNGGHLDGFCHPPPGPDSPGALAERRRVPGAAPPTGRVPR